MGRQATINLDDVRRARDELIAANRSHGIIAIRRHIGRGSPQLISKLLTQIRHSERSSAEADAHLYDASVATSHQQNSNELGQAWRDFSAQVGTLLATSSSAVPSQPLSEDYSARLAALEQLVSDQQLVLERLRNLNTNLEEQLMQQQDLFESWRHEQQAERQMLKNQFEQLSKLASASKPKVKRKKRGQQLDLYDNK